MKFGQMHARMERWATWCATGQLAKGIGYGTCTGSGGGVRAQAPGLAEDCIRLHEQLARLPQDLRTAVQVFYLGQGSMRAKAATLGCSAPTLYDRVNRAHALLQGGAERPIPWCGRLGNRFPGR